MYQPQVLLKVKIGDPGWTGATAIANLLAAVVIDKMGGEAELVPGNNTAIMERLIEAKVKSKFTLIFGCQIKKLIQRFSTKRNIKIKQNPYEEIKAIGFSTICKKMNITAIEDLGRQKLLKQWIVMEMEKVSFGLVDGWASANVNQVKLRDYKLYDAGIEPIRAAEAVKNARVLTRSKKVRLCILLLQTSYYLGNADVVIGRTKV